MFSLYIIKIYAHVFYVCLFFTIYIYIFKINTHIFFFPLFGVGNIIPASPSTLFYGLSLNTDDDAFEVIESPTSSAGFDQINDNIDDEKASTIIESEETNNNHTPQIRQNSVPTPFSTFKVAILNGISVEKINK
jgi:hypothetical protein